MGGIIVNNMDKKSKKNISAGANVYKRTEVSRGGRTKSVNKRPIGAIIFLAIFAVAMILGYVFGFTSAEIGTTDYHAFIPSIKLGLDLEGGVYAAYDAKRPDKDVTDDEFKASISGTVEVLQNLLFSKGYTEAQVTTFADGTSIRVEVPNANDDDEIFQLISKPKKLEFYETDAQGNKVNAVGKPEITGDYISSASVGYDQSTQKYTVQLKFNNSGSTKFKEITTRLKGKNLGIFLGGEFLMAPTVNDTIPNGQAVITGDYTYEQAYQMAVQIQSGAMPVELELRESGNIGATLGASAKSEGLIAGGVGLLLVIIFMCWRYRLLGVAASLSLIFFTITYLFFLSIFPWVQLTLPGIAGILLSIGMAVDANVIIFERVREERAKNINLADSIKNGFKRSYSAILDGNITTIIGSVVLILLATASVKGFAITLLIGIIISLISSLFMTRWIIKAFMSITGKAGKAEAESLDRLYGTHAVLVDYTVVHKRLAKGVINLVDGNKVAKEVK